MDQSGLTETIYAPATAPGKAGIAVLRLSGPNCAAIVGALTAKPMPAPRRAALRDFTDPDGGAVIDRGLLLWFPAPASFTGEDMAEFHVHGGRAVTAAMLAGLAATGLARLAEPGEFARRAFDNGKLDLTEAEAIADLVAAETEQQRRQALRQMEGALFALYEGWRARLLEALARVEAEIDFADQDLPGDQLTGARAQFSAVAGEIARHLDDANRGERLRQGARVAIIGPPNAGKSSLLNALARRDVAIVSATAGTTRDVIEVALDLGGWPVVLIDTAGLRESGDEIEREGVRRAQAQAEHADLRLILVDATAPQAAAPALKLARLGDIAIANKTDLAPQPPGVDAAISVKTGAGMEKLLGLLQNAVAASLGAGAGEPPLTRQRHRSALEECLAALRRIEAGADQAATLGHELLAEDGRLAARALGRITGRTGVEDMLDIVFAEFCIGK